MIINGKKLTTKYFLRTKTESLDKEYPYTLYLQVTYNRETTKVGVFTHNHSTLGVLGKAEKTINDSSNEELNELKSRVFLKLDEVLKYDIERSPKNYKLKGLNQRLERYAFRVADAVNRPVSLLNFYKDKLPDYAYDSLYETVVDGRATIGEVMNGISFYLNGYENYLSDKLRTIVLSSVLLKIIFGDSFFNPKEYKCKESLLCVDWITEESIKNTLRKKALTLDEKKVYPGVMRILKDLKFKESDIDNCIDEISSCISFYILHGVDEDLFDRYYLGHF